MTVFAQLGHFEDGFGSDDWQDVDVLLDIWSPGSGTTPTQGNSNRFGRFIQLPHLVLYQFQYGVGSTFVATSGADTYILSLPVPARRQIGDHPLAVDKVMGMCTLTQGAVSTKSGAITPILSDYPGKTYGPGSGTTSGIYGGTNWVQFLLPEAQDQGTGTIAAGTLTTSVTFTGGLALLAAPAASDITITWTALSGGAGVWKGYAVTGLTTTGFTISINANTSTDMTFSWKLNNSSGVNALTGGTVKLAAGMLIEGFLFYEPEVG